MRILGFLLLVGSYAWFIIDIGQPGLMFSENAIVAVLLPTIFLLMMMYDREAWVSFARLLTFRYAPVDKEQDLKLIRFLSSGSRASMVTGVLYFLIYSVWGLATIRDPSTIGPSLSIDLLSLFYGFGLSELVFRPLAVVVQEKSHQKSPLVD